MDLNLTPQELQFRDELRAWLKENVPDPWSEPLDEPQARDRYWSFLRDWQRKLFEGGWTGFSWPKEYGGRGASAIEQAIFQEEIALADAPQRVSALGEALIGPTIIAAGTEDQKRRYLRNILSGEEVWCQGFSEPNAGSDLASLGTQAVRDGDDFILNGQKIWTSIAQVADWCLLLVRTDTEAPKHKGITCLLTDMHSEGVEVRPLRQMTDDSGFNEVFFSDVRVPVTNVLGEVDGGWKVGITALMNERTNLGSGVYVLIKRTLDALIERAGTIRRNGKTAAEDPLIRQKIAQVVVDLEVFRLNMNRALTKLSTTAVPGPEGSILKLCWSELNQRLAQTAMETVGPYGQLAEFDNGRWSYNYLRSRGNTIEAGTSEVQRNIVAQRVLGLPKSY